jgi:hypothetical protein
VLKTRFIQLVLLCAAAVGGSHVLAFGLQLTSDTRALEGINSSGIGPCHDAWVDGSLLVTVGEGRLYTSDVSEPLAPRLLGHLDGLGAVRQVVISEEIAYVAAREDGLAIVDLHDPENPRLLARFDTLEKATGIAVAGNLCFVACRYYGVQIIDVSEPSSPVHLSVAFRTLEAQSVAWSDGVLYAGIWATREVAVADVSNPRSPREIARIKLDGYGDGVTVRDGVLYAATGHHSRLFTGATHDMSQQNSPGWGAGHGMELWDVRTPSQPRLLSRYKTRAFYAGVPDMWSVDVCDGIALLTDTFNGVEAIDVSDTSHPKPLARFLPPGGKPAGGLGAGPGVLYVAGLETALHVVPLEAIRPEPVVTVPATPIPPRTDATNLISGWTQFHPGGQIREAAALTGGGFALAAGDSGVHLVTLDPSPAVIATLPSSGAARSVSVCGDLLGVAEGMNSEGKGGVSIWRLPSSGTPQLLGRWQGGDTAVMQVVIPPPGRWAVIEKGIRELAVLDLADPARPQEVASWIGPGVFYGPQIASAAVEGRYLAWWWHAGGPYWLDLNAPGHPAPFRPIEGNLNSGVTGMAVDGDAALVLRRNGAVRLRPDEDRDVTELPLMLLAENSFGRNNMNGQAAVSGRLLWYANAAWSQLAVAELPESGTSIRLVSVIQPPGNPGRPLIAHGWVVIPDGYEGIMFASLSTFQ